MHPASPSRSSATTSKNLGTTTVSRRLRELVGVNARAVALILGLTVTSTAIAENCGRVNAYWHTNMQSLVENIGSCDSSSWQSCSQAAAIHYDLMFGSLGQRATSCGLQTPAVPGRDYTEPQATDTRSCLSARNDLKDIFETRALARLACAAAREGGDDQEWLDSQCKMYRSQMSNYHLSFRSVAQHCELDYEQLVATLDQ